MDKSRQIEMLIGAVVDYRDKLLSLGVLIQKIEALLGIISDRPLRDLLFDDLLALEEVHARVCNGDFDFDKFGRTVVDAATQSIIDKLT